MTPKKIIYVGSKFGLSGSSSKILDLVKNIDLDRYEFSILLRPDKNEHSRINEIPEAIERIPFQWNDIFFMRGFIKRFLFMIHMIIEVNKRKPDYFIVGQRSLITRILSLKFLINKNVKIILTWGNVASWHTNRKPLLRYLYSKILPKANIIICPSELPAEDLIDFFKINPEKVRVIYNPIDFEEYKPKTDKNVEINDSKILLFVGRLVSRKDAQCVIKAFQKSLKYRSDLKLWIVGDGNKRQELERLAVDLRVSDKVKFWGFKKNTKPFYEKADVFIHSSHMEGFGIVLNEALAFNIPVVYADGEVGALTAIKKFNIGHSYTPGSYDELSNQIIKALDITNYKTDPEYLKLFDISTYVREFEKLFEDN